MSIVLRHSFHFYFKIWLHDYACMCVLEQLAIYIISTNHKTYAILFLFLFLYE